MWSKGFGGTSVRSLVLTHRVGDPWTRRKAGSPRPPDGSAAGLTVIAPLGLSVSERRSM